jgi:uncharacterized protein (TIGR02145 family)
MPTDDEWVILTNYLTNNGYGYGIFVDQIAKSMASTSGWATSSEAGTIGNNQASNNSSGFSALPGGCRAANGQFVEVGNRGYWWSFTEGSTPTPYYRHLSSVSNSVYRAFTSGKDGFSVRCLMDNRRFDYLIYKQTWNLSVILLPTHDKIL